MFRVILIVTFLYIMGSRTEQVTEIKCYFTHSIFWTFKAKSAFEKYEMNMYHSSFLKLGNPDVKRCTIGKKVQISCKILNFHEQQSMRRYGGKRRYFEIVGFKNSSTSNNHTVSYILSNFTYLFDYCHLASCANVINVAQISFTKPELKGSLRLEWNIEANNLYNKRTFVSARKFGSNKTEIFNKSLHSVYKLEDKCGFYNVCVTTQWKACLFDDTEEIFHRSDCRNISMELPYTKLPKPVFTCNFDNVNKNVLLKLLPKLFQSFRYYIYDRKDNLISSYNTTKTTSFVYVRSDNVVYVNLKACISCYCVALTDVCSVSNPVTSQSKGNIAVIVLISCGLIFAMFLSIGFILWCRKRLQQNNDDVEETDENIILPAHSYTEIPNIETQHKYHTVKPESDDEECVIEK